MVQVFLLKIVYLNERLFTLWVWGGYSAVKGLVLDQFASQSFFQAWAVGSWAKARAPWQLPLLVPGTPHSITVG